MAWRGNASGSRLQPIDPVVEARGFARSHLAPTRVKIFLDGVPLEGRTAAFLTPYEPVSGRPPDEHGMLLVPPQTLFPALIEFDKAGLTVKFHAVGDAAVCEALMRSRQRAQPTVRRDHATRWRMLTLLIRRLRACPAVERGVRVFARDLESRPTHCGDPSRRRLSHRWRVASA